MSGPNTPTKPVNPQGSNVGLEFGHPENSERTNSSAPGSMDDTLGTGDDSGADASSRTPLFPDAPTPVTPDRVSVLKSTNTPPSSELVFHGTEDFLKSAFFVPPTSSNSDEDQCQPSPIYAIQRSDQQLTQNVGASTYDTRVSFDTLDKRHATDISFTLVCKHKDYKYTRRSRTFLCGNDANDYSEFALEWLVDELVGDGDEIVCLRVVDKDSAVNSKNSVELENYKIEARQLLQKVQEKNGNGKSISLVLELAAGNVEDIIQRMIQIYSPVSLIVGTRGRSRGGIKGLLPANSISKYCLENSPVPVIIVRPEEQRKKKREKRSAKSKGSTYNPVLDQSPSNTSATDAAQASSSGTTAPAGESTAVAKAVGLKSNWGGKKASEQKIVRDTNVDKAVEETREGPSEAPLNERAETPSPRGPLMMDVIDNDMPKVDLGSSLSDDGSDDEGEGKSNTSSHSNLNRRKDKDYDIETAGLNTTGKSSPTKGTDAGMDGVLSETDETDEDDEIERVKAMSLEEYDRAQVKQMGGKDVS